MFKLSWFLFILSDLLSPSNEAILRNMTNEMIHSVFFWWLLTLQKGRGHTSWIFSRMLPKTLLFCIIQCKLNIWISILIFTSNIINQIYLIIFQPNSLVILEKWNIFICNRDVGTASERKSFIYTSRRYVNDVTQMLINKESYWLTLTLLHLEVRPRTCDCSIFCIKNASS